MRIKPQSIETSLLQYVIHITLGGAISAGLFYTVSLSFETKELPEPPKEARRIQSAKMPPPPDQPSEVTEAQIENTSFAETQKFLLLDKTTEVALFKTSIRPQKESNILEKTEVDFSMFQIEEQDLEQTLVFEKSDVDRAPKPIYRTMPKVDSENKKEEIRVMFVVNKEGKVGKIYILESSNAEINQDVITGVKTWTFFPARKNDESVNCWVRMKIIIRPGDSMFSV